MWNLKDIKEKKRYVIERLKKCKNNKEKEYLQMSLMSYVFMLDNSGNLRYTRFYNFLDKISSNKFTLIQESKYEKIENDLFRVEDYLDEEYLSLLLNICNNIAFNSDDNNEDYNYSKIECPDDVLIATSCEFYNSLQNQELASYANRILTDQESLNFTEYARYGNENFQGITFRDYIFNKAYCNVRRQNTIFDFQVLNHEVMHGIEFYISKKLPSETHYGFDEITTYAIDYLFIDYLEEKGFDQEQVEVLRQRKKDYVQYLAIKTRFQIKSLLMRKYGSKNSTNLTFDQIKSALNFNILKSLKEIQSEVIAYGLYEQSKDSQTIAINNLLEFIKKPLAKDQKPSFSFINLSDEDLIRLSINYGKNQQQNKNVTVHI